MKPSATPPTLNPEVSTYLSEMSQWKDEMNAFRQIALETGLTEEWKWRQPCYTFGGKNIALLGAFKNFCCLSFFKGALLNDAATLLEKPGKNSQSSRIFKATEMGPIQRHSATLKAYLFEAIEIEKAGLKVETKDSSEFELVSELEAAFKTNAPLKEAFEALTLGRQRGYNLYFEAAKQSATRTKRIEKLAPRILAGYGIHDCVCGRSKRMPTCDGSHNRYPDSRPF